jgi:hypothetical protein
LPACVTRRRTDPQSLQGFIEPGRDLREQIVAALETHEHRFDLVGRARFAHGGLQVKTRLI